MMMSPSCACCVEACGLADLTISNTGTWEIVAGTWDFGAITSSTAGTLLYKSRRHAGGQWLRLKVRASAAGQVAEVLVQTDDAATEGLAVRLTFAAVCGELQLFEDGAAIDDPYPLDGLVPDEWHAVEILVTADSVFAGVWLNRDATGVPDVSASGKIATPNSDRLGLRVAGGLVEFSAMQWERLALSGGGECHSDEICGSPFEIIADWYYAAGDGDTCQFHTIGTPPTEVQSLHPVSEYDREEGFGVIGRADVGLPGVMSVFIDNDHHEARVTTALEQANPDQQGMREWATFVAGTYKDGNLIAETEKFYYAPELPAGSTLTFEVHAGFWGDRFVVRSDGFDSGELFDVISPRVNDGHAHKVVASGTNALVTRHIITRCPDDFVCSFCDDATDKKQVARGAPLQLKVVVAIGDPIDGTHIINRNPQPPPLYAGSCVWGVTTGDGVLLTLSEPPGNPAVLFVRVRSGALTVQGSLELTAPVNCLDWLDVSVDLYDGATLVGDAEVTAL